MSMVRAAVYDNGIVRMPQSGDLIANSEAILADATAGNLAITGAKMASGILSRSGPGAGYADSFPTATDLVNSLMGSGNFVGTGAISAQGVQPGLSFRFRIINTVAFVNTVTAGAGGTLAGVTAVAASTYRDYLVTVTNGTPPQIVAGNTTNASAVVTGMNSGLLQFLTQGMTVSGTGIPGGATIASVQPGVGITLSANATATNTGTALTFGPSYTVAGIGSGAI